MHKLTAETIAQIGQELNALELNNPVKGWDRTYPYVFKALQDIILAAAAQSRSIVFSININQTDAVTARSTRMGTTQIDFGVSVARKFLLEDMPSESTPYAEFITLVAQAIEQAFQEMMAQASIELATLENNPGSRTDASTPISHLYTLLCRIIIPLSNKAGMPITPTLSFYFSGTSKHQAAAQILRNGTMMLFIGSEFIRNFLIHRWEQIKQSPGDQAAVENRVAAHRQFEWVIAHEIGHLCDPGYKIYVRLIHPILLTLSLSCLFFLGQGVIKLNYPTAWALFPPAGAMIVITISSLSIAIIKCIEIFMVKRFEYAADKISVRLLAGTFVPNHALVALQATRAKIFNDLFSNLPISKNSYNDSANPAHQMVGTILSRLTKIYNACYKAIAQPFLTHRHPSIKNRMKRITQLYSRQNSPK
jgi:hypothetical protein